MASEILTPALHLISGANLVALGADFLPSANQATAVAAALERLDGDRPRIVTYAFTGAGSQAFDLSGATGWLDGVSQIQSVHCPWVLGTDSEMDLDDWDVLQDPVNLDTLYLYTARPSASEQVLIYYSVPWTEGTVPTLLKYKVAKLAAANMARMMAARFAQGADGTINVDTFSRNSAAGDWTRLAKDLESEYEKAIGTSSEAAVRAASTEVQLLPPQSHGLGKLHPYNTEGE